MAEYDDGEDFAVFDVEHPIEDVELLEERLDTLNDIEDDDKRMHAATAVLGALYGDDLEVPQ